MRDSVVVTQWSHKPLGESLTWVRIPLPLFKGYMLGGLVA